MDIREAIELAKNGEERGFGYLYENTYKSKYYLALQYMKNEEDAKDVLQDAYIKAFHNLDKLQSPEAFSSWLGTIVANTAKNKLKQKNPMLFTDVTPEGEDSFELQIEDDAVQNQPEVAYTRKETQEMVHELMDALSPEQRICILMFHIEGASIQEIAQTLECSENTVKSRLNYGRKNLKESAENLQKKGYKLYGLSPLPLLLLLLGSDKSAMAADGSLSVGGKAVVDSVFRNLYGTHTADNTMGENGAGNQMGKGAASAAKTGFVHTTAGKIVIAIVAVGIIGGSTAFGILQISKHTAPPAKQETQEVPDKEEAKEEPKEDETIESLAAEAYKQAVSQIDSYDFQMSDASVTAQQYALVDMNEDGIPELLLKNSDDFGYEYIKVFTYDGEKKTLIEAQDVLNTGVASAGGFRGGIVASNQSHGLLLSQGSSGNGEFVTYRVLLEGESLTNEVVDEFRLGDTQNSEITAEGIEIIWYDIKDDSELIRLENQEWEQATVSEESGAATEEENQQSQVEADGITTFAGTIQVLSSKDLCALQGISNPNPGTEDRMTVVLVFDAPMDVAAMNADQETITRNATMMKLSNDYMDDFGNWGQYDQQHMVIQVNNGIYWPSDTSLPLGEPGTSGASVIS